MVLRDGRNVGTLTTPQTSRDQLITLMVGRTVAEMYPKQKIALGEVVLEVKDFELPGAFSNIHFTLRRGEILGLFGLLGCGKDQIIEAIYGITERASGELLLKGGPASIHSPSQATRNHIGFVPIDRKKDGVALSMKVKENIVLANIGGLGKHLFINGLLFNQKARKWVRALNIKTPGIDTGAESLSGGNQQKVVLAKCLESGAQIIIMNEPTRGVDVGAKVEIYGIMEEICRNGGSILMISSDLPEIMSLADRIIVVSKGAITGVLEAGQYTQEKLLHAANL
jgi:ribose transport system ATP-binding protein